MNDICFESEAIKYCYFLVPFYSPLRNLGVKSSVLVEVYSKLFRLGSTEEENGLENELGLVFLGFQDDLFNVRSKRAKMAF